jgi:hypothetical protein
VPLSTPLPVSAPVDEELAIRAAARRAEDAGDLVGALRLLRLLGDDAELVRWRTSLAAGLRCRDETERARWLLQPAFRHGFVSAARQALLTLAADVLRTRGRAAVAGSGETADAAVVDPLLIDAGLFDLGMLGDYLSRVLRPGGSPLVPLLARWPACRVSVFEVDGTDPVLLTDLVHARPVDGPVLVDGLEVGSLVYGRILPLPQGSCFSAPPVPVDRLTARRIARAVLRSAPPVEPLRAVASFQRRTAAPSTS